MTPVYRVADFPERIPLVPPTLADFECDHGRIGGCADCAAENATGEGDDDDA